MADHPPLTCWTTLDRIANGVIQAASWCKLLRISMNEKLSTMVLRLFWSAILFPGTNSSQPISIRHLSLRELGRERQASSNHWRTVQFSSTT